MEEGYETGTKIAWCRGFKFCGRSRTGKAVNAGLNSNLQPLALGLPT